MEIISPEQSHSYERRTCLNNLDGLHNPGQTNRPLVFPSESGLSTGQCDLLATKGQKSKIIDEGDR